MINLPLEEVAQSKNQVIFNFSAIVPPIFIVFANTELPQSDPTLTSCPKSALFLSKTVPKQWDC